MDLEGLTLQQLRVFARVAETLSFTITSDELHVSQSVVSRTIQTIERKTGVELFARTSRSVEITSAGAELLTIVDRTLATHGAGLARFEKFLAGAAGSVSVVALPSVAATVLPPVVRGFTEDRPDTVVSVSDGLADEIVDSVAVGRADLGLTAHVTQAEPLIQTPWRSDELLALLPSGHPLTSQRSVTWSDLAMYPFIGLAEGSSVRRLTDAGFTQAKSMPRHVHVVRSPLAVYGMVAGGLGVAALPAFLARMAPQRTTVSVRLHSPNVRRSLVVVTSPNHARSPAAQHFINHLLARAPMDE